MFREGRVSEVGVYINVEGRFYAIKLEEGPHKGKWCVPFWEISKEEGATSRKAKVIEMALKDLGCKVDPYCTSYLLGLGAGMLRELFSCHILEGELPKENAGFFDPRKCVEQEWEPVSYQIIKEVLVGDEDDDPYGWVCP